MRGREPPPSPWGGALHLPFPRGEAGAGEAEWLAEGWAVGQGGQARKRGAGMLAPHLPARVPTGARLPL